jgi:hypothetical protein
VPHWTYDQRHLGRAEILPAGPFTAGEYTSFEFRYTDYTAGFFGINNSGSLKIVQRFASDMGAPQVQDPQAPGQALRIVRQT